MAPSGPSCTLFSGVWTHGTAFPNVIFFNAVRHIPAGTMAVLLTLVPIMTYLLVVIVRLEKVDIIRLGGILLGLYGALLIALPTVSGGIQIDVQVLLAMLCPLGYALMGVYVAKRRLSDVHPFHLAAGYPCDCDPVPAPDCGVHGAVSSDLGRTGTNRGTDIVSRCSGRRGLFAFFQDCRTGRRGILQFEPLPHCADRACLGMGPVRRDAQHDVLAGGAVHFIRINHRQFASTRHRSKSTSSRAITARSHSGSWPVDKYRTYFDPDNPVILDFRHFRPIF